MSRVVCWFSCGATSAVATKLTLAEHGDVVIVYTDPGGEHPDNVRFRRDCERWFGQEIIVLKNPDFVDHFDVFDKTGYLVGPTGARCTAELKRKMRFGFQRWDDRQVWGYDAGEQDRVDLFRRNNPEIEILTPLLDRGLSKDDCLAIIDRAGITLPAMYLLGYQNNNCIGCPKGGMGYWNKIRADFPETFERMAVYERESGNTCLRVEVGGGSRKTVPLFLDEMNPDRGNYSTEHHMECSLLCAATEIDMERTS